ncbi:MULTISPECIES: hypothetical protein [Methylobacterium]|uniref:Porin n=1 Tax=Methylobacterium jeotgali TaxID=381630 RepID=A0ABQ4T010_9HYPH|nr:MULTISPECIES: hypothetical protein [Methylobacterium]PIU05320.1 MAG: hypothetical protein COT56_15590 [Methylobacterium sp. CG09_land_8_20_14_0_10_71_15]PIU15990.1 MAG: hypothetical protein COT28_02510 [Methylobacterium sp. CG08_land_8_20_14_0_20_71_15]GBU19914.1 hypothetical protein AwMethylo_41290 [Methylobacterium sp.]GJE07359.1 hypothetical protein AOPFMNJM_2687 [Methylobacterium jeotgali]
MVHASPDAGSRPLVRALGLALALMSAPAFAQGAEPLPLGPAPAPRFAPPPAAHPCCRPRPVVQAPGGPVVRAYLPRNLAVPMYNEPPPRFPSF